MDVTTTVRPYGGLLVDLRVDAQRSERLRHAAKKYYQTQQQDAGLAAPREASRILDRYYRQPSLARDAAGDG